MSDTVVHAYFSDDEGNLSIKKDGKLVSVDRPRRKYKQVNSAKLARIMENEDYELVLVKNGCGEVSAAISSDEKDSSCGLFSKRPYMRASYNIPYENIKIAVLHNDFLYTARKEGDMMYVDREDAAWWWYMDKIMLLPILFWTSPELKVFEFNRDKEKKSET